MTPEIILGGLVSAFLSLVVWLLQRGVSRIIGRLDRIEERQQDCRVEIVRTYATKGELKELETRVDSHECRIGRLEAN